ncbi:hypothetical protein C8R48DRAFT_679712 [Suillus tomentosus]|nr:hypothetical protein C8R48DRAFT_679712 [Suillus tomentosus]
MVQSSKFKRTVDFALSTHLPTKHLFLSHYSMIRANSMVPFGSLQGCSLQGSKGSTIMLTFMLELSVSFLESLCQVCVLASGCVTMFYISVVPSHLNLALVCVLVSGCVATSGVAFSAWKSLCLIFVFVLWGTFMRCMPLWLPLLILGDFHAVHATLRQLFLIQLTLSRYNFQS